MSSVTPKITVVRRSVCVIMKFALSHNSGDGSDNTLHWSVKDFAACIVEHA